MWRENREREREWEWGNLSEVPLSLHYIYFVIFTLYHYSVPRELPHVFSLRQHISVPLAIILGTFLNKQMCTYIKTWTEGDDSKENVQKKELGDFKFVTQQVSFGYSAAENHFDLKDPADRDWLALMPNDTWEAIKHQSKCWKPGKL